MSENTEDKSPAAEEATTESQTTETGGPPSADTQQAEASQAEPGADATQTTTGSTSTNTPETTESSGVPLASNAEPASEAAPSSAEVASAHSESALTSNKSGSKLQRSPSSRHQSVSASSSPASSSQRQPSASPGSKASAPRRKRQKLGELDLSEAKIGFLGAGKMTESTINGLIHYAKISPGRIHVAAPSTKNLEKFRALGCRVTKRNYDIFGRYDCDIVFLCFHGYVIKHCYKLGGTRPHPLTTNYIPHQRHPIYILSMVSGVNLSQVGACLLNPDSRQSYKLEMHRIMMNTAVGHGLGICAVDCEPDSRRLSPPIRQLLSSIAHLEHVPASQMDAACAIGGSGLAFSYYFINALADGAFKMGLSRQQAIRFASKTAQCAAQTMLESGKHPAELRDNVSSPSGAAIYGIHVLEKNDVASGVTAAVEAAHKRANDLATQEVN